MAVARGDKGGEGGDEPEAGLGDGLPEDIGLGLIDFIEMVADDERGEGGEDDGDDVGLAEDAVEGEVALAEAGGELEGADSEGDEAGESVGRKASFSPKTRSRLGLGWTK